ncbi:hypothetical protein LAUMK35_01952 [Mycobacterium pseudokansasii]|nr:hypothetical protein LAUMK35_01952 [Mycobacterium pseudokansasii]VAZ93425.1 hypothetical protein LAUMK21_01954 [Mycobacterium pseudokansasii]
MGGGQFRHRGSIRDPESAVLPRCGRHVHEAPVGVVRGGCPDCGELGVEEQGLVLVAVHCPRDDLVTGALQGFGDGVGEHRVRAHLDEGTAAMVLGGSCGSNGLAESHRVAQVGRPIVGIHHRARMRFTGVSGRDNRDARWLRGQIRERGSQFGQDRVDDRVMGGHVDLDASGQPILCGNRSDYRVHRLGRPGDHRLPRRCIHCQRHLRIVGDQRVGGIGIEFEQRHRALTRQPGHQPRPGGDHLQALLGCQRAGHDRRGHLTHRMPDHRIRCHAVGPPQLGQG